MSKRIIYTLSLLWLLWSGTTAIAQIDTLAAEAADRTRIYRIFIEDTDKDVSHIWKVNVVDFRLSDPNLGFEQRLGKSFSSESYLRIRKTMGGFNLSQGLDNYSISLKEQIRWYHNLKFREKRGKRVCGFSGNYFGLGGIASVFNGSYQIEINNNYGVIHMLSDQETMGMQLGLAFEYGLQRRIGNIGYLDLFLGIKYYDLWSKYYGDDPTIQTDILPMRGGFKFVFGVRAGFAVSSVRNLKHMLRR